jgi:hypothetical protein
LTSFVTSSSTFERINSRIDNDRWSIKVFVIVQGKPESLPVTFVFMTMRHPRIQVLAGTDWSLLGYGLDGFVDIYPENAI